MCCCWYHKGTNFQANHNTSKYNVLLFSVVADTTKVRIFKQITTRTGNRPIATKLLLIPQRYEFSSKSQLRQKKTFTTDSCCWYHKGTNFQANHNFVLRISPPSNVVADTTKVRIFKQITTRWCSLDKKRPLLLIPQRYEFSSKSQQNDALTKENDVVADTTKVRIFKQITTLLH